MQVDAHVPSGTRAGTDKEIAAQATIMLATCDEAVQLFKTDTEQYYSPYRRLLKTRYGQTEAFAAAVTHCPDIAAWNKKFKFFCKFIWLIKNNVATFAIPIGGYRSAERLVCSEDR
ncbi:hypothetical protein [Chitinophaga sp. Ak27]|uniref:hypothetical protein n=1 Tax=Chitinophaga sp. Ak27 TaxID=2726116 RepID=UPI00145FBB69|nr:hypothetical protein [Chitinophaga sp. Ak27]NLU93148.1 hypothetical protein [Chitinophaga sp. Ak27]